MVQRTSEALKINTGNGVQVQQSGMGFVNPDTDRFSTSKVTEGYRPQGDSSATRILSRILDVGQKLTEQKFKQNTEEAYLSGVAKAGQIESEAELDANPIMKHWQTAGYRDTMGRVAAADHEATIATDMHKMREKSPEEFGTYLSEKRAKVMESWEGMSLPVRQTMFAQQVMNERAAVKKHAVEHYKFGEETENKAIKVAVDTSLNSLNASKGHEDTYNAATDAAWTTVYNSVAVNPKLRNETRGGMVADIAKHALATNNIKLYGAIMNRSARMADGSQGTMASLLSRDESIALSNAERAAVERVAGMKSLGFHSDLSIARANWDNPEVPLPPYKDVLEMVNRGHAEGHFGQGLDSATKAAAVLGDYSRAAVKHEKTGKLAGLYITGNVGGLSQAGGTRLEALAAFENGPGRNLTVGQKVGAIMNQGLTHGWPESMTKVGEIMRPAWSQVMMQDAVNPENALMIHGVMTALNGAEAKGEQAVMHQYIGAFDQPTQEFILRVRSNVKSGDSGEAAIMKARTAVLEESKAGGSGLHAALRTQNEKADAASLSTVTPTKMFGSMWDTVKSVFSSAAEQRKALEVRAAYFENPSRVAENEAMVKGALAEELSNISRDRPFMTPEDRFTLANQRVIGRSVVTPWGPLIAQSGRTVEATYGIKDPERVSKALQEMIVPADGHRVSFVYDTNGQLVVTHRNTKDGTSKSQVMNPMDVKAVAEKQRKEEEAHYIVLAGGGKMGGATKNVKYDGVNASGVDRQEMFDLRKRLLVNEGYSDVAKPDVGGRINKKTGKPVMTVGPGLSDTGTYYPKLDKDGKITPAQASEGFALATDEAAKYAKNWQVGTRTAHKPAAFQFFAEMAYQGGGGNKAMNPLIVAIRDSDKVKAKAALLATPAWQMAHKERRTFYETQLNKLME